MGPTASSARGSRGLHVCLLALVGLVLVWSAIGPRDRFTWWLEVAPAIVGALLLVVTYRRFRFTSLAYVLMAFHAVVLIVGGHYTYAGVPWFDNLAELLGSTRNHYDRLGHFAQGFVPAIVAREILLRRTPLRRGGWLFFIVVSICLGFSAFYELIEWWVALATGSAAESFLGTQGDVWDTQWDMFLALCGALSAQLFLGKIHDRQLDALH